MEGTQVVLVAPHRHLLRTDRGSAQGVVDIYELKSTCRGITDHYQYSWRTSHLPPPIHVDAYLISLVRRLYQLNRHKERNDAVRVWHLAHQLQGGDRHDRFFMV